MIYEHHLCFFNWIVKERGNSGAAPKLPQITKTQGVASTLLLHGIHTFHAAENTGKKSCTKAFELENRYDGLD